MASLAAAASTAKRRVPILMSFYGRLRSTTCYFERREREGEKEGEKLGKTKKIYGPSPEDLEAHIRHAHGGRTYYRPGYVIPAPCISETKCYYESAAGPEIKSADDSFVNLNANGNPNIVIHSYDKDDRPYFRAYSVDEEDGSMSPKYYMYPPSLPITEDWIFYGATCNGLFHFLNAADDSVREHLFWNPATEEKEKKTTEDGPLMT